MQSTSATPNAGADGQAHAIQFGGNGPGTENTIGDDVRTEWKGTLE